MQSLRGWGGANACWRRLLVVGMNSTLAFEHGSITLLTLGQSKFVSCVTTIHDFLFQGPGTLVGSQNADAQLIAPGTIARFSGGSVTLTQLTVSDFTGADAFVFEEGAVGIIAHAAMDSWNATGLRSDARSAFLTVQSAASVRITDSTFTDCRGEAAGAVNVHSNGSFAATRCSFSRCRSGQSGGAVSAEVTTRLDAPVCARCSHGCSAEWPRGAEIFKH